MYNGFRSHAREEKHLLIMMMVNRGPNVFCGHAHFPCRGGNFSQCGRHDGKQIRQHLLDLPWSHSSALRRGSARQPCIWFCLTFSRWTFDGVLGFQNAIKDNLIICKNNIFSAFFLLSFRLSFLPHSPCGVTFLPLKGTKMFKQAKVKDSGGLIVFG